MPIETVLEALEGARKSGAGWSANCPAHEDRAPSLSISEGDDGKVLLFCHAGCSFASILKAAGLEEGDLFPPKDGAGKRVVAEYAYTDEAGAELFRAVRFEPKAFRQKRREGDAWTWNLNGTRRVLYRLPELLEGVKAGRTIYIAEGEKDVEALRSLGLVATCNPMGAGKWRDEFSETLRGARVVVVADKDEPGRKHAAAVAGSLSGKVASVVVAEVAEGKDAAEAIAAGATREDFESMDVEGPEESEPEAEAGPSCPTIFEALQEPEPAITWAIANLVAAGSIWVLASEGGVGKSTLLVQAFVSLAAGRPFLGFEVPQALRCLFLEAEGNRTIFHNRIRVALHHLGVPNMGEGLPFYVAPRRLTFDLRAHEFRQHVLAARPDFVALDTIGLFHDGEENSNTDFKEKVVKPLREIGREVEDLTGRPVGWVLVHHEAKPSEFRKGRAKVRGAGAMFDDSDSFMRLEAPNGPRAQERTLFIDKVRGAPLPKDLPLVFEGETATYRPGEAVDTAEAEREREQRAVFGYAAKFEEVVRATPGLVTKQVEELAGPASTATKCAARKHLVAEQRVRFEGLNGTPLAWFPDSPSFHMGAK